VRRNISRRSGNGIDTLVLGCTHYPLLKAVISRAVGPGITLIDSATETATEVVDVPREAQVARDRTGEGPGNSM